jgi:hypothetical protein
MAEGVRSRVLFDPFVLVLVLVLVNRHCIEDEDESGSSVLCLLSSVLCHLTSGFSIPDAQYSILVTGCWKKWLKAQGAKLRL